jgi:hypothetical protein
MARKIVIFSFSRKASAVYGCTSANVGGPTLGSWPHKIREEPSGGGGELVSLNIGDGYWARAPSISPKWARAAFGARLQLSVGKALGTCA